MKLSEKLAHLRRVEGMHRGLDRGMSKAEVVRAMERELGESISHAYLCQLEGGTRLHMTGRTRELLARFFKVLPGYLVDDPAGFETSLRTEMTSELDGLSSRLAAQAEHLRRDEPALAHVLFKLSRAEDPVRFVTLLDRLLELSPSALERVAETIEREEDGNDQGRSVTG